MKNQIIYTIVALFASFTANAQDFTGFIEEDVIEGDIAAPVTFITYASATCGHCARFEKQVIANVMKDYVKSGKVAYAFREYPLDDLATAVAKVQRCAPKKSYYKFVSAFFNAQSQWRDVPNKLEAIKNIARIGGMTPQQVEKCIADPKLQKEVNKLKESGIALGIDATPSFVINGKVYRGGRTYSEVKQYIDQHLN